MGARVARQCRRFCVWRRDCSAGFGRPALCGVEPTGRHAPEDRRCSPTIYLFVSSSGRLDVGSAPAVSLCALLGHTRLAHLFTNSFARCRRAAHFICSLASGEAICGTVRKRDRAACALGVAFTRLVCSRPVDPLCANADARDDALKRAALLLFLAALLLADGGTVLFRKQAGPFLIAAFAQPTPVRVGTADISAMVQRVTDQQTILDASVNIHLRQSTEGRIVEVVAPATHANATNKLLYAAHVKIPSSGTWTVSVDVNA